MTYLEVDRELLGDPDRFRKLWTKKPSDAIWEIAGLEREASDRVMLADKRELYRGWERLPMIHKDDCRGDEPGNLLAHWGCREPRVFHPELFREFHSDIRSEMLEVIHPDNLQLVWDNVLDRSRAIRGIYAGLPIVAEEHWEILARERELVSVIVGNPFLPDDLAAVLVHRHKTPSIRISIAHNTGSNDVLNRIWSSTKSEQIRAAVEENAVFQELYIFGNGKGLR